MPIPEPIHYDPADYELVRRAMKAGFRVSVPGGGGNVPGKKTDWKMFGTFGEFPNSQWEYPNASWPRQLEIVAEYKQKALGLLKFFRTDPAVDSATRAKVAALGLCRDEYNRSENWMGQLYVRSALRMVSNRVLTERDVVSSTFRGVGPDGIGLGAYTVDIPGPVQTILQPDEDGHMEVVNEGALKVGPSTHPVFCDRELAPFALPYSIMLPKRGEVDNLVVPVAVSASHVAFNSVRMEPTWMILGQSAGVAAAMAAAKPTDPRLWAVPIPALQSRLRQLGQLLAPPALPPAPVPPSFHCLPPNGSWYAYRPDWNYSVGTDGVHVAIANDVHTCPQGALLKRCLEHSTMLPSADLRCYPPGTTIQLHAAPRAFSSQYEIVEPVRVADA